jgi:hypothetical protein
VLLSHEGTRVVICDGYMEAKMMLCGYAHELFSHLVKRRIDTGLVDLTKLVKLC